VIEIETHKVIADNYKGAYDAPCILFNWCYRRIAAVIQPALYLITKERPGWLQSSSYDHALSK
jgi:LacI family transcriptional regulator